MASLFGLGLIYVASRIMAVNIAVADWLPVYHFTYMD